MWETGAAQGRAPSKWSYAVSSLEASFFVVDRLNNVFIIGKGTKAWVSLPAQKGIRLTIAEERDKRLANKGN